MQEQLEINDIQGIIIRGYAHLPAAGFLLLSGKDAAAAKSWLGMILEDITPGHHKPEGTAVHIAFSFAGLKALGLDQGILDSFPMELEDGMTTKHKQQFLGDFAASSPAHWEWGGPQNEPVHILLMIYAKDAFTLVEKTDACRKNFGACGIQEIKSLSTTVLYERKEHFGFHDGISQPTIQGLNRTDTPGNSVAAGEFILGYKNEYGQYTPRPAVPSNVDARKILPALPNGRDHDLGLNGSYIVFRQLKQDVSLFWKYMATATQNSDGSVNENAMVKLASKMVGRWPDGTPLVLSPDKEDKQLENSTDFDYRHTDPEGTKCPFAAHTRRSSPRDSLDTDRTTSIAIAKKHRILRRGRSYGTPLTETLKPIDCLNATQSDDERGLHFICVNADISRQFEFVQNAWINDPKFNGLYEERDPVTGNHHNPQDTKTTGTFSVRNSGLRTRFTDIPEFTTVKGGAYFFLPGIRALRFLAS